MGKLAALRLGIRKGEYEKPLCPNEHDYNSLDRIANKWRYSLVLNRVAGAHELTVSLAMKKHDELCNPAHPKEYCSCEWCENRRIFLASNRD